MTSQYSSLLSPLRIIAAERSHSYDFLTERHIQAIWFEQKYFKNLRTFSGDPIEVISPGIWNADAGPDFRKCHLKIGQRTVFGDVEIHLSDDFWYQHQHDQDPKYNQVVLHVSLWHPKNLRPVVLQNGETVPQTHLENCLTVPQARIVQLVDLDLYPYKKFLGSGNCAHDVFRKASENEIVGFFQKAAEWRLQNKRTYLKSRLAEDSECLGAGIAMALGYKNNAEAFLELYLNLKKYPIDSEEKTLAALMSSCGFFEKKYQEKWKDSSFYKRLKDLSYDQQDLPQVKLNLNQIRPLNHPIRRLVYLVKMHHDAKMTNLFENMKKHWDHHWAKCTQTKKWKDLLEQLKDMLPSYTDKHWNHHYSFEKAERNEFLPLIGQDIKREILINTFLPLLQGHVIERGDHKEMIGFQNFFEAFPASRTGKAKYLVHRYFGKTDKGHLLNKAYTEQGAYQLHYDFCVHYEASCEGCPFVERYHKTFGV